MTRIYDLGPFRLDAETGALTKAGAPAALGARAVAVLTALVRHANEYVSKATLMDEAWPGLVVEESNLAVQVLAIRRVLAQVPGGERWIETLIGRGYRFVGPISEAGDERQGWRSDKRSNLPEALTSFIGRERELVDIKRLLPTKRLVTVVGVGGIGKTRLALQIAAEVADAYRDGVWLAELESIRDSLLVPTSIAQALGVQERPGMPVTQSLRAHLKSRQVLLILDNCEHLLDACAALADALLRSSTETTILATSREPLRLAGEQIYSLQPMSLPDASRSAETIRHSEAVQLFVERVRRQLPDFELTTARAAVVAELCIHLDGIPLALELAAARARSLSVEQINARLGDRFRLLTGGSRTALPRQQTLRATLDWSYDLLAEDERVVLRRLAVFPGSFTVEAASAVASDANLDDFAVVDLLSRLAARSLLVADMNAGGTRYDLLETTRAYAREKLADVDETDACQRRHAEYFCALFKHAPDDWLRMSAPQWRGLYVDEVENVRAAIDWALESGADPKIGITLAGGAAPLWPESGLWSEGIKRLQDALRVAERQTLPSDQARLWFWLGVLRNQDPAQASGDYRRAVEMYRHAGDMTWLGFSLQRAGASLLYLGRTEQSAAFFAEAAPLVEAAGLPALLAEYLLMIGTLKWFTGDLTGARTEMEKSAAVCQESGCARVARGVLANLAELAWMTGDLDTALARCREAVDLARKSPGQRRGGDLGMYLTNLAGVHVERGELDAALSAAREGLPLRREVGSAAWALDHLALRVALTGNIAGAARIEGHADHVYATRAAERQPNEARACERLRTILKANLAPDELERLLAEGAKMSEEEACRMALEE